MVKCSNCGAQNISGATTCYNCGADLIGSSLSDRMLSQRMTGRETIKSGGKWLTEKPKNKYWSAAHRGLSGNIKLKVRTRWMETLVILVIGAIFYLNFHQALIFAAIAMFAIYILFPNENDIIQDAVEEFEKNKEIERKRRGKQKIGEEGEIAKERRHGELEAEAEFRNETDEEIYRRRRGE